MTSCDIPGDGNLYHWAGQGVARSLTAKLLYFPSLFYYLETGYYIEPVPKVGGGEIKLHLLQRGVLFGILPKKEDPFSPIYLFIPSFIYSGVDSQVCTSFVCK